MFVFYITTTGIIFMYAPSKWETTLECNVASHWLGAYSKLFLWWYDILKEMPSVMT